MAEFMRQLPLARGENLATDIFEDHRPRLEVHHQHGLELSFGSFQLHLDAQDESQEEKPRLALLFGIHMVVSDAVGLPLLRYWTSE